MPNYNDNNTVLEIILRITNYKTNLGTPVLLLRSRREWVLDSLGAISKSSYCDSWLLPWCYTMKKWHH